MSTQILSFALGILGIIGALVLLALTGIILHTYRGCRPGNFRWHLRNTYLKQISALACLFFLAMTASYIVLQEDWALLYLIIAFKTGTWWLRFSVNQRS